MHFIEDYKRLEFLWNPNLKAYSYKVKRLQAYNELSTKFNCSVDDVKRKIKNLRCYFFKEHDKCSKRKGKLNAEDAYQSSWFAYDALMFLINKSGRSTPRKSRSKEECCGDGNSSLVYPKFKADLESDQNEEMDTTSQPNLELNDNTQVNPETDAKNLKREDQVRSDRKRKLTKREKRKLAKAYYYIKAVGNKQNKRDEFKIFGEHVTCRIKKLNNPRLQSIAQNRIQQQLFELEMEKYQFTI